MTEDWNEMIRQRIQQGWTDEQIAVSVPFSLNHIMSIRQRQTGISEVASCEHDYKEIDSNIEVEQNSFLDRDSNIELDVKGYIIFYCRKCTDIQKVVLE